MRAAGTLVGATLWRGLGKGIEARGRLGIAGRRTEASDNRCSLPGLWSRAVCYLASSTLVGLGTFLPWLEALKLVVDLDSNTCATLGICLAQTGDGFSSNLPLLCSVGGRFSVITVSASIKKQEHLCWWLSFGAGIGV